MLSIQEVLLQHCHASSTYIALQRFARIKQGGFHALNSYTARRTYYNVEEDRITGHYFCVQCMHLKERFNSMEEAVNTLNGLLIKLRFYL